MLTLDTITTHLGAVLDLARGKRDALTRIDASFEGFWRSFATIILVIPIYVPYVWSEYALIIKSEAYAEDFPFAAYLFTRATGLVLDWICFPLAILLLADVLDLRRQFARYITIYNWSHVVIAVPLALPGILFGAGMIPGPLATLLVFLGLIIFARIRYMLARTVLDATPGKAFGLVALDFGLGLVIAELISRVSGF